MVDNGNLFQAKTSVFLLPQAQKEKDPFVKEAVEYSLCKSFSSWIEQAVCIKNEWGFFVCMAAECNKGVYFFVNGDRRHMCRFMCGHKATNVFCSNGSDHVSVVLREALWWNSGVIVEDMVMQCHQDLFYLYAIMLTYASKYASMFTYECVYSYIDGISEPGSYWETENK